MSLTRKRKGKTLRVVSRFKPNAAQKRFKKAIQQYRNGLLAAGVGTGKTYGGSRYASEIAEMNKGCAGYIVGHSLDAVRNVLIPDFLSHWPEEAVFEHNKNEKRT